MSNALRKITKTGLWVQIKSTGRLLRECGQCSLANDEVFLRQAILEDARAANAIGDDTLQKQASGRVGPRS